jgi:hypothetical protein
MASLACGVYAVALLKLYSYGQVNLWCRTATGGFRGQAKGKHAVRHQSLADLGAPPPPVSRTSATSNCYCS